MFDSTSLSDYPAPTLVNSGTQDLKPRICCEGLTCAEAIYTVGEAEIELEGLAAATGACTCYFVSAATLILVRIERNKTLSFLKTLRIWAKVSVWHSKVEIPTRFLVLPTNRLPTRSGRSHGRRSIG